MPEVQVVFPPATDPDTSLTNVKVQAPTVVTNQHERVTWNIYNCDDRIKYAQVEIMNGGSATFFTAADPLRYGREIEGKVSIYTDIPDLAATRPVLLKYTIRGWADDTMSTLIRQLDPEILVNEP